MSDKHDLKKTSRAKTQNKKVSKTSRKKVRKIFHSKSFFVLLLLAVFVYALFFSSKPLVDRNSNASIFVHEIYYTFFPDKRPTEQTVQQGGVAFKTEEVSEATHSVASANGAKTILADYAQDSEVATDSLQLPLSLEIPICSKKIDSSHERISHNGFELCYREEFEQAEWVAYEFSKGKLEKVAKRANNFRSDASVSTKSATPADYTRSGYDRGHLAPAADMAWSEEAMSDSFYMSNMSPQEPSFNRGVWKNLEENTRVWAEKFEKIYVVSGPVLEKRAGEYKSIGKNEVSVPEFYYKVLLAQKSDFSLCCIAFILPNAAYNGSFYDFAVSVDEVEDRTGIDFFSQLDDKTEAFVESTYELSDWK